MTNFDYEKAKPMLIEYFVRIRGEANRDDITRRINQSELVFIYDSDDLISKYNHSLIRKKIELTIKFLELNGFSIPEDIKIKALANNESSILKEIPGAKNLIETYFDGNTYDNVSFYGFRSLFIEEHKEDEISIKNKVKILKKMGANVEVENYFEFINSKEAIPFLIEIEKQKRIIGILDKDFEEFLNSEDLLAEKEKAEKVQTTKSSLYDKNLLLFVKSIKEFLSDSDRKKIDDFIASGSIYITSLVCSLDSYGLFFNNNINNPGCIEAFSTESIGILNNPDAHNFEKSDIISNQIKYFKQKGLYDGSIPFEEFLKTEIAKSNMPDRSFVDYISSQRKGCQKKAEEEFFMATSSYVENVEQLSSMGLSINPEYEADFIKKGTHFITPCQRIVNGKNDICSIIYFRALDVFSNYRDIDFIHEISHVIETSLISENGVEMYKSGFELIPINNEGARENENFNEVINQLFAIEVTEAMHEDGIFLFDDPRFSLVRGGASYEHNISIINNFYEIYKENISNSRISQSLDELYRIVGENNFTTLNDLVNKYSSLPIGRDFCKTDEESSKLEHRKKTLIVQFNEIIDETTNKELKG